MSPSSRYEDSARQKLESSLDENFVLDEDLTARVIKVEEVDRNVIDETSSNQGGLDDASQPKKLASNIQLLNNSDEPLITMELFLKDL